MRAIEGPEHTSLVDEHRHNNSHIRQVTTAVIRVIQQEHVAQQDVVAEILDHFLRCPGHGANVNGNMLSLRDQPPIGIAKRHREVAATVEDLRIGSAQHRLAHFLDDARQSVLDDRRSDRIDFDCHDETPVLTSAA